jgi:dienelactone hydrolase
MQRRPSVIGNLATFLAFVSLVLCAGATQAQESYRSFKPATGGPAPILLFVSGCSGFVKFGDLDYYAEQAETMRAAGYFVVYVDYIGKRGLPNCSGGRIDHATVGQDMAAALAWAKAQPGVDPNRAYSIGWSFGGGGTIAALNAGIPLNKAVMIYPDCRGARAWSKPVPTLALFGSADTVAPPALCEEPFKSAPAGSLRSITYPEAYHGFDVRSLPAKTTYAFGIIGYKKEAADAAWLEIAAFLK